MYKQWAIDMVSVIHRHLKLDTLGPRHYNRHVSGTSWHRPWCLKQKIHLHIWSKVQQFSKSAIPPYSYYLNAGSQFRGMLAFGSRPVPETTLIPIRLLQKLLCRIYIVVLMQKGICQTPTKIFATPGRNTANCSQFWRSCREILYSREGQGQPRISNVVRRTAMKGFIYVQSRLYRVRKFGTCSRTHKVS